MTAQLAQALNGLVWSSWLAFLVGSLVRRVLKSCIAESLDRTVAGSVEVKGMKRSLRQEGVPDADRQQLVTEVWRRNLDLDDPTATWHRSTFMSLVGSVIGEQLCGAF